LVKIENDKERIKEIVDCARALKVYFHNVDEFVDEEII